MCVLSLKRTVYDTFFARDGSEFEHGVHLPQCICKSCLYLVRVKVGVCNYRNKAPVDAVCCISESVFRRLFFACKGMSPVDYRNRLRVKKASELLQSGSFTVAEAAEQVGINDLKYFGKLFKRYAAVTPRTIKNNKL